MYNVTYSPAKEWKKWKSELSKNNVFEIIYTCENVTWLRGSFSGD